MPMPRSIATSTQDLTAINLRQAILLAYVLIKPMELQQESLSLPVGHTSRPTYVYLNNKPLPKLKRCMAALPKNGTSNSCIWLGQVKTCHSTSGKWLQTRFNVCVIRCRETRQITAMAFGSIALRARSCHLEKQVPGINVELARFQSQGPKLRPTILCKPKMKDPRNCCLTH